jgi:lipoprotein-releasing system permease protein
VKRFKFVCQLALRFSGILRPFSLSSWLSVLGLVFGVATLVLSLALVESYEKAFKEGIFSIYSHVNLRLADESEGLDSVREKAFKVYKKEIHLSAISRKEALLAHKGSVSGVSVVGVDPNTIDQVIDIKRKLKEGTYFSKSSEFKEALIGIDLQKNFKLKVGDFFSVVVPIRDYNRTEGFSRKILRLKVAGIVDFGTHDYNRRFVMTRRSFVNDIIEKNEDYFSEVRIKLYDADDAALFRSLWIEEWSASDFVSTSQDESGGLIEAIQIEKVVIFFLVLIMVIVAAFNVSTNLFLNLSKRQKDFSILRTTGLRKKDIAFMLSLNGFLLGLVGLFFGFILAYCIQYLLNFILIKGYFVPPEVYKLTSLTISLEPKQMIIVSFSTLVLCFISALAPAFGIFKQSIVGGIKYE